MHDNSGIVLQGALECCFDLGHVFFLFTNISMKEVDHQSIFITSASVNEVYLQRIIMYTYVSINIDYKGNKKIRDGIKIPVLQHYQRTPMESNKSLP